MGIPFSFCYYDMEFFFCILVFLLEKNRGQILICNGTKVVILFSNRDRIDKKA